MHAPEPTIFRDRPDVMSPPLGSVNNTVIEPPMSEPVKSAKQESDFGGDFWEKLRGKDKKEPSIYIDEATPGPRDNHDPS